MSDPPSGLSRLVSDIKQDFSEFSNQHRKIEAELKSILEIHGFALTNLHHTERGVALAMGAYLDTICRDNIMGWMAQDAAIRKDAFGERGFLGSFAAKIQFMYVVGVYSKQVYDILMTIARIRNRFAHDFDITSFSHPKIKGLVDNLKPQDIMVMIDGNSDPVRIGELSHQEVKDVFSSTAKAEDRFLAAVNSLVFIIQYASKRIIETGQLTPHDPQFGI